MFGKSEKYALKYFQPGQIAFFVSHPGLDGRKDPKIKDLTREFLDKSNKILQGTKKTAKLSLTSRHSFPKIEAKVDPRTYYKKDSKSGTKLGPRVTNRDESSLIFANIKGVDNDPIEFLEFIEEFEQVLVENQRDKDLKLESISPNWLASSSPKPGGTGGPGGWPVAYRGNPSFAPYRFNLSIIKADSNSNRGKDVDVIILDTVPSRWDITFAYRRCKDWHPLIHSMLRPNGPLKLYPAPLHERYRLADLRAFGYDYRMSDHGLFVAGIIHSIAPCARIHLVEVLNPYGVGDFKSILRGLNFALNREFQRADDIALPFVVNCSLTLNLPLVEDHFHTIAHKDGDCFIDLFTDFDRELEKAILDYGLDRIKHHADAFGAACDGILKPNSRIVAAAGNDRRPGQETAPEARYPAAFDSVEGVGALPRDVTLTNSGARRTASYSNKADLPVNIGIATFGGEEGEGEGVLGLYLGKFPGGGANRTKWAWWSGTSFATPVLSGIRAAQLSDSPHGFGHNGERDPLEDGLQNDNGESGEDVLAVTQGIPL